MEQQPLCGRGLDWVCAPHQRGGAGWVRGRLEGGAAVAINIAVLLVFALQHSVMARPTFKRWWTRFVPPAIERSTYVLLSTVALVLVFVAWQPMPAVLWDLRGTLAGHHFAHTRSVTSAHAVPSAKPAHTSLR